MEKKDSIKTLLLTLWKSEDDKVTKTESGELGSAVSAYIAVSYTHLRPAQVPEEKLDETFTSIPPAELGYGDDEPEEDASDTPRASGSSFDEIDDAGI